MRKAEDGRFDYVLGIMRKDSRGTGAVYRKDARCCLVDER